MSKISSVIEIEFSDRNIAYAVYKAILPEVKNPPSERVNIRISLVDNKIILNTSATTISSLRAAINSYLRWIYSISETCKKLVKEYGRTNTTRITE